MLEFRPMIRRLLLAALLLAAPMPPPAQAAPAHVLTVTIDLYYDPVLPALGCRQGRVTGYGTAVDPLAAGVVLPFTFDTEQHICANASADQYCAQIAGALQGVLCVSRTLTFMTTAGELIIDGHPHQIRASMLAWVPTSMPPAAAVASGLVVLQ